MEDTIGIDVSKDKPDAYRLSKREHKQVCNDKTGLRHLHFGQIKPGSHASFLNRPAFIIVASKRDWLITR
jgi:hypothetical protein